MLVWSGVSSHACMEWGSLSRLYMSGVSSHGYMEWG